MFLKKTFKSLFAFILMFLVVASLAPTAQAGFNPTNCGAIIVTRASNDDFKDTYGQTQGNIKLTFAGLAPGETYYLTFLDGIGDTAGPTAGQVYNGQPLTFNLPIIAINTHADSFSYRVVLKRDTLAVGGFNPTVCELGTTTITKTVNLKCEFRVTQTRGTQTCDIMADSTRCVERGKSLFVEVSVRDQNNQPVNTRLDAEIRQGLCLTTNCWKSAIPGNGQNTFEFTTNDYPAGNGTFEIRVSQDTGGSNYIQCPSLPYTLTEGECKNAAGQPICGADGGLRPPTDPTAGGANPYRLCEQIPNASLRAQCESCAGGPFGRDGVWTAVGCVKRDPKSIIQSLMQIGLGMGGGVALLSTLAGGFILSTSQGDPTKANQAKEIITNSVIGLLFVIFSVVILQFIGVTIFNIPGFGAVK